jgi:hypothetical protein
MTLRSAGAALLVSLGTAPAFAQRTEAPRQPVIAAGLAEDQVDVKVNYSGARIVLFATAPSGEAESAGMAVALIGPSEPAKVIRVTPTGEQSF